MQQKKSINKCLFIKKIAIQLPALTKLEEKWI